MVANEGTETNETMNATTYNDAPGAGDAASPISSSCADTAVVGAPMTPLAHMLGDKDVHEMSSAGLCNWLEKQGAKRRLQVELRELAGTDYRMVTNMAACMAKKGVGFYGSQGWTGGSGVWEWDSRTAPSRGSKGKLQMEGKSLQRRWKCKRQLEGAEGEGGMRGWVEDAAAEAAVVQYRGMTGGGVCMLLRPECEYDGRDERSGEGIED